jgi:hypothetical protein
MSFTFHASRITTMSTPLSPPNQSRLTQLAALLQTRQGQLHYVDYKQAEQDCERLAALLLQQITRPELATFHFAPIPRGGLIVLGMLAYILDLQPAQLLPQPNDQRPLVLVDDCALTGGRFGRFLAQTTAAPVIFAHLYSHPALRQAILEREARVSHCLAAHDLADHPPDDPALYAGWQSRWRERLGAGRYWIGQPDLVCFAWSEPDQPFFNPASGQIEDGWRFLPPHACLKNKAALAVPPSLQETSQRLNSESQPASEPPGGLYNWRVSSQVVTGRFDDLLWLCHTGSGQLFSLDGVAADMWRALAAYGHIATAAAYLLTLYAIPAATLHHDLTAFTHTLAAKGLLEPA